MTKKNLIKSLAFLPVVTGTIAMTPAPALAFWNLFGPSHQQVCESILPDIEKSLPGYMKKWGGQVAQVQQFAPGVNNYSVKKSWWTWTEPDDLQYSGNVTAVKTHRDIISIGYKPVTGCVTRFTYRRIDDREYTYILKFNVESDEQSGKYYYSTIPPHSLNS